MALDESRAVDGEPFLQATARAPEARLSARTAEAAGISSLAMISNDRGSITLPAVVDPEMAEGVVWLPSRAPGLGIPQNLAASAGDLVTIGPGEELEMSAELIEGVASTGSGPIDTGSGRSADDTEASQ